jgi:hypothetical protein
VLKVDEERWGGLWSGQPTLRGSRIFGDLFLRRRPLPFSRPKNFDDLFFFSYFSHFFSNRTPPKKPSRTPPPPPPTQHEPSIPLSTPLAWPHLKPSPMSPLSTPREGGSRGLTSKVGGSLQRWGGSSQRWGAEPPEPPPPSL